MIDCVVNVLILTFVIGVGAFVVSSLFDKIFFDGGEDDWL